METQDDIVQRLAVLEALVLALQTENAALKAENARLKRLLEQDSSNSHKPPSTDPPSKTPPQKRPTKKRGPKHGHSAFQRLATPPDHVLVHRPTRCGCGCALDDALPELGRAHLQHIELVDKPFITTGHLLVRLRCPACKRVVRAKPPAGVSRSPYGPRARALVAALTGLAQASKRPTQLLLGSLGLRLSLGMLSKLEGQSAALLAAPVEQAKEALHEQAWLGCDETVLKQAGARKYLWVAVGALMAVFGFGGRSRQDKQRVLQSDFAGVVLTDRYNVYEEHAADRRQACWAHLMREMKAREKEGEADSVWAGLLWRQAQTMFLARSMMERGAGGIRLVIRERAVPRAGVRAAGASKAGSAAGQAVEVDAGAPSVAVCIRGCGGRGANEQRERACAARSGGVAQAQPRSSERARRRVCGGDDERARIPEQAAAQPLHLPH
jgi:transposase